MICTADPAGKRGCRSSIAGGVTGGQRLRVAAVTTSKRRDPIYTDPRYYRWRAAVLKRDGYRCQVCGCDVSGKGKARAHHRTPIKAGGSPFDVSNGVTLCNEHHEQAHRDRSAGGAAGTPGLMVVRGCDADGWPLDPARRG